MARSSSHSGSNTPYAAGQQNYNYDVLFDHSSTSPYSHIFDVVENFVRIAAFNLTAGNTLTIEQVTGQGAGDSFADYCPISGPATLYYTSATDQRTSYVLERPGRYRVRLDGPGLGMITVFQINFFMENEASQDIADALFSLLKSFKPTPCTIGQLIPMDVAPSPLNVIGKNAQGCLIQYPLTACDIGHQIAAGTYSGSVIGKDPTGCLVEFPLSGPTPPPNPCTIGALVPVGNPLYFLGVDSNNCMVKFVVTPGNGINITYDTTNHIVNISNQCFPCGSTPVGIVANLCITAAPGDLNGGACDAAPGTVNYNETLRFAVNSVTGGTPPYTYDWTNFTGVATWAPSLGGTSAQTLTPSGNTFVVSNDLTGANAGNATNGFEFDISAASHVIIHDSAAASLTLYYSALEIAGHCSSATSPPAFGESYVANITCTSGPCTPDTADITVTQNYSTPSTPVGANIGVAATISVDNWNSDTCCSGSFTADATIHITITDPLNTMGQGTLYTAPSVPVPNVYPNFSDVGGGPATDWPASILVADPTSSWPQQDACNGSNGHGPEGGFGHNMTLDLTFDYTIPAPLLSDGAVHTATISITGAALDTSLGDYRTTTGLCCPNDILIPMDDVDLIVHFGP